MKKYFLCFTITALFTACGGGDKKNEVESKQKEENKEAAANDASQNPDYQKGMAIVAESKNLCLTCHKIDDKLVGPSYREVANKYENTEANVNMLAEKVVKGGKGVWGEVPMPANAVISLDDAKAAVKYILLLKNNK